MIHDSALPFLMFFSGTWRENTVIPVHTTQFSFFLFLFFWHLILNLERERGQLNYQAWFSKVKYLNTMTKKTSLPGNKLALLLLGGRGGSAWRGSGFGSTGCSSYCDGRWNLWSAGASLDDISPGRTAACCWTLLGASWKKQRETTWIQLRSTDLQLFSANTSWDHEVV